MKLPFFKSGNGTVSQANGGTALAGAIREDMYESSAFEGPWGMRQPTYVDYAASGRMLKSFDTLMQEHVHPWYANTHTETAEFGMRMHRMMEEARGRVAVTVGADRTKYAVIFTGAGSTGAIAKMALLIARPRPYLEEEKNLPKIAQASGASRMSRTRSIKEAVLGASKSFHDKVAQRLPGVALETVLRTKDAWSLGQVNASIKRRPAVVFVGPFEHHSNELAWREAGLEVVVIGEDADGRVNLEELESWLSKCQKEDPSRLLIGSFSAGSNVTGIAAQVEEIAELIHKYRGLAFFDYAGAGSYMPIQMEYSDRPQAYKDAVFTSPHKFIGGPGATGVLVARRELFDPYDAPSIPGGGTVHFVTRDSHVFHEDPEAREEAGTPNVLGNIRAGLAFDLLRRTFQDKETKAFESAMLQRLINGLMEIPNVKVVGSERKAFFDFSRRCSIVPFLIRAPATGSGKHLLLHQNFVAAVLNDLYGIQSRGGCSCAGPYGNDLLRDILMRQGTEESVWGDFKFGFDAINNPEPIGAALLTGVVQHNEVINKPGWCRISIKYVLKPEDIDFILAAVAQIAKDGWKLMPQYTLSITSSEWTHKESVKNTSGGSHQAQLPVWTPEGAKSSATVSKKKPALARLQQDYLKFADGVYKNAEKWVKDNWSSNGEEVDDDAIWLTAKSEMVRWWMRPKEALPLMGLNEDEL